MIELGISKMALIGAIALIVIGPEKLPRVARTVGALLGKAQRYVADVRAEVNRSMELDELKKMKDSVETAARDVQSSMQSTADGFEQSWAEATSALEQAATPVEVPSMVVFPEYKHPGKKWRVKQGAMPQWFKARAGVRTRAQSGAARVARFRPRSSAQG
jgi:sec-independent protein translocase protein TatB